MENAEVKTIKKAVIVDLLIDKLYDCLEVENGKIHWDKYNMNSKEVLYLLKNYDEEKYNANCNLLLASIKKEED